jgi:hypothetical protein
MFPVPIVTPELVGVQQARRQQFDKIKELIYGSIQQKKPYSAVTVAVESLTSEQYEEDDLSGIPDLVEAIKLQATGPAEAARAIRKKLKYGNVHRQIRALTILDGLIQNAGPRFQRTFADEMLLERLRVCGTSDLSDPLVKAKCKELFRQWAVEYKNTRGLEQVTALYKVPQTIMFKHRPNSNSTGTTSPQAGRHSREVEGCTRNSGKPIRRR